MTQHPIARRKTPHNIWQYIMPPPLSPMILDNLGLTISLKALEGWKDYRQARANLFGTNWLSRFWMQWIFPRIKPRRWAALVDEFEAQRRRMQQQYLTAVLGAAE
jgi:hypothetical protein